MEDNKFQPAEVEDDISSPEHSINAIVVAIVFFVGMVLLFISLEGGESIVVVVLSALLYFVPTAVAWNRKHNNRAAIVTLNTLLGWSVIGWVGALVWAMTKDVEKEEGT